jgi:hypothetical protein
MQVTLGLLRLSKLDIRKLDISGEVMSITIGVRRIPLNQGGYDRRGRYYGTGAPLYEWDYYNSETKDEEYGELRAYSRADAKEQVKSYLTRRGYKVNPGENGEWTPVHAVRFNSDGSVSLMGTHLNPAKLGSGGRFKVLTGELSHKPGIYDPKGLAAAIGRRKYGAKKFAQLAARGKRRKHR